jgi:hypothetical protein
LTVLLTAACATPVAIVMVMAVGRLLGAMQDTAAAAVLDRVALALGIVWSVNLVCLLVALALETLGRPPGSSDG